MSIIDRGAIKRLTPVVVNVVNEPSDGIWCNAAATAVSGVLGNGDSVSGLALPVGYSPISFKQITAITISGTAYLAYK